MSRPPTQEDVAALAGVSRSTVSLVLNNRTDRPIPISEETRRKVWEAAEKLGYEPNALARSLRSGQSHSIGVLAPNVFNLHYLEILDSIERNLARRGYYLTLVISNFDPQRERRCFRSLFQQRLDGLILMPTFLDVMPDEVATLTELRRPVVFLTPGSDGHDRVTSNLRAGAEEMMDHLLSLGHKRIAFINGVARGELTLQRQAAYREKLEAAGIPFDERLFVNCGPTMADGYRSTLALLRSDAAPTAIWTINDLLAVGARRAIYEMGLRVPEDVALAGCDGTALAAQMAPPLTTIEIQTEEIGRRAVDLLLGRIADPERDPVQEVLGTRLLIRPSTDFSLRKAGISDTAKVRMR